tara:strand:- start:30131 stop:30529 length:399 start_codon:yes stop_codon:yes gene_type:complete
MIRTILSLVVPFFMLVGCSSDPSGSEIGQYTTMEVEQTIDAGTVAKGEIVEAQITLKNTGDYPLVIADVKEACSCTVSEYPEEPIAPGKTGTILASVDTDRTGKGVINKPVTITANTRPSTTTVTITAKVID